MLQQVNQSTECEYLSLRFWLLYYYCVLEIIAGNVQ